MPHPLARPHDEKNSGAAADESAVSKFPLLEQLILAYNTVDWEETSASDDRVSLINIIEGMLGNPKLKTFEMDWNERVEYGVFDDFDRLISPLTNTTLPSSVEQFACRTMDSAHPLRPIEVECIKNASFRIFEHLRVLHLPQEALFDVGTTDLDDLMSMDLTKVFPQHLERLEVTGPSEGILIWLESFISAKGHLMALQGIVLICRDDWGKGAAWFRQQNDSVITRLRKIGIEVQISGSEDGLEHIALNNGEDEFLLDVFGIGEQEDSTESIRSIAQEDMIYDYGQGADSGGIEKLDVRQLFT